MRKHTAPKTHSSNVSSRSIAPLPWSYFVVIAVCGCLLAAGFFLAARQHFISMEVGMKNSTLRKQLEELESENRRLLLAREVSLSPSEITRTARNLGFREVILGATDVPAATLAKVQMPKPAGKPSAAGSPSSVTMTAYQRPTSAVTKAASKETVRNAEPAKQKAIKPELTAFAKR